MISGVVVDVDDTLYLEREYVRSGFDVVGTWCRQELGVDGVGVRAWKLFDEGRRSTTLTDALSDLGIQADAELRAQLVRCYREHDPRIGLLPDAVDFLRRVTESGLPVAVITDGPASSQRAKCRALGLFELAEPVVLTEELGTSKPDPAPYRRVAEVWALPHRELLYVADNPAKDFVAPLDLGWSTVRVRRAGSLHEAVATPRGVLELTDLASYDVTG